MRTFLAEMMMGGHEELPRRRPVDDIAYDPAQGCFVATEAERPASEWLCRGELPGDERRAEPATAGETVAEETMRELAERLRPGRGVDGAGGLELPGPAVPPKHGAVSDGDFVAREQRMKEHAPRNQRDR